MMDPVFSKDSFKQVKLFIGASMYGGTTTSSCLKGLMDLTTSCVNYNIPLRVCGSANQSLVQKARNYCVNSFLQTDFTHFLFIDSDIGFTAEDVLSLLKCMAQDEKKQYDILAGLYPKKAISWDSVREAVQKGLNEKDHAALYSPLSPLQEPFSEKDPIEVLAVDAGFMMIPRRTFEMFKATYPETACLAPQGKEEFVFFDCGVDPKTRFYQAEDQRFCQHVREMGGRIWAAPWINLSHQGTFSFKGSYKHKT